MVTSHEERAMWLTRWALLVLLAIVLALKGEEIFRACAAIPCKWCISNSNSVHIVRYSLTYTVKTELFFPLHL
ncbi:hypothetical protein F4801DRAFT_164821 [Xylaria longipes]|nr:hypothetical protein F4801DRAFT_164821 [Xylaria longipes]